MLGSIVPLAELTRSLVIYFRDNQGMNYSVAMDCNKKYFVNTELAVRSVLRSGGFPKLCLKSGPVLKRSHT